MSNADKQKLEQQLWNIANELRGKMGADEFRDYILGFIFYKYLSEKLRHFADRILTQDGIKYKDINESTAQGTAYLELCKEEDIDPDKMNKIIGDYLYSNQTIQRDDVIQSLNEKPKLLERKPVAQGVIDRIYTFVDTFVHGLAG